MNRFQRARMEEEEELKRAIEASLAESENQGTSSLANEEHGARTNETSPLVASDQPVAEKVTPTETSTSLDESANKGFVDGLVSSVFEASRDVSAGKVSFSRVLTCVVTPQ